MVWGLGSGFWGIGLSGKSENHVDKNMEHEMRYSLNS